MFQVISARAGAAHAMRTRPAQKVQHGFRDFARANRTSGAIRAVLPTRNAPSAEHRLEVHASLVEASGRCLGSARRWTSAAHRRIKSNGASAPGDCPSPPAGFLGVQAPFADSLHPWKSWPYATSHSDACLAGRWRRVLTPAKGQGRRFPAGKCPARLARGERAERLPPRDDNPHARDVLARMWSLPP